jgi:hypothetical protein
MTVILKNGEIHIADPDAEGKTTYCGIDYSPDNTEKIMSGAYYVDQLLADMRTEYPEASDCEDCAEGLDEQGH